MGNGLEQVGHPMVPMPSDPGRIAVYRASGGAHLVAIVGDESAPLHWAAYLVDEEGTAGPRDLGCWLKFVPSDYAPSDGPHPPAVESLIVRLGPDRGRA
jgi:hypothetical protein